MEERIIIDNTWVKGRRIGKGGFGSIYLATNIETQELGAIKIEDLRVSELLYGETMVIKALNNASKKNQKKEEQFSKDIYLLQLRPIMLKSCLNGRILSKSS